MNKGIAVAEKPAFEERGKEKVRQKQNCWEFKKCGREPNGAKVAELGICPSTTEKRLDGIHGGKNAGRACWVIAGTLCKGEVQGTFAKKYENCSKCDFYIKVHSEENHHFQLSSVLLSNL